LIDRRHENSEPTSGAQRGTIENAMSDDSIPDRSRPHVCSRFALQQSIKQTSSRKTRTIEFVRFASAHWTIDRFLPVRRVERRLQMRVVEHVRAFENATSKINRGAESNQRIERRDVRRANECELSIVASMNGNERGTRDARDSSGTFSSVP